jgi:hypothetical protein
MSDISKSNYLKIGIALGVLAIGFLVYARANKVTKTEIEEEKCDDYEFTPDRINGALQVNNGTLELELSKKVKITHDTYNFHFKLPQEDQELGLYLGGHLFFFATIPTPEHPDGEVIRR